MKHFYAIVHKGRNSAYGVEFPDLPGCFSAAGELCDVIRHAREALALWFDDAPETEPRSPERLKETMTGQLPAGAFLMPIPFVRRDLPPCKPTPQSMPPRSR
ncbi:type II toxin-antitoxin system HicB family antitoxin [Croceicoccus hydrothermalis]|uniref:type II toxin-antitoxin system HicB family antitoxin n=1 Tax=Croceicoccus hydrothermalis TaxID=2867964 RepID=UPI001EFAD614|nr:type II toxin-antitoxin system HicB family antitoxin [Croceicoccus hydrothermalis]